VRSGWAIRIAVALCALLPGALAAETVGAGAALAASPVPHLDHVAVIVMESPDAGQVVGSSDAPFVTQLAKQYATASDYHDVSGSTVADYLALISGSTQGVTSDCEVCFFSGGTIVDRLEAAAKAGHLHGAPWRAYMDGLPQPCFVGDAGTYTQEHDPFVYFDSVRSNPRRCANVVPMGRLNQDLASGGLPAYAFIAPDLCHDMETCGVAAGDQWLSQTVPSIFDAPDFRQNAALFIVWDQAGGGSDHVTLVAAGPSVARGRVLQQRADDFGLLRTIDAALGIAPVGQGDAAAQPLVGLLQANGRPATLPDPPHASPACKPATPGLGSGSGILWGMYQTHYPSNYATIQALQGDLGHPVNVVHWYAQWTDGQDSGFAGWNENVGPIRQVLARGQIPMITWEAWGSGSSFPLSDIAAGKFDGYIDSWARGAASLKPQPLWIRLFHEFNDNTNYPWQVPKNGPAVFVAAWRHVHDRFTQAGATNVAWIWDADGPSMNVDSLRAAYPGDQYVTYTGWDDYGYDSAADYRVMSAVSSKPMVLGEVGGTSPGWLSTFTSLVDGGAMPLVRAVVWFDEKGSALETHPAALTAVRSLVSGHTFHVLNALSLTASPGGSCPNAPIRPAPVVIGLELLRVSGGGVSGLAVNQQPVAGLPDL
jgi:hypothetical protein